MIIEIIYECPSCKKTRGESRQHNDPGIGFAINPCLVCFERMNKIRENSPTIENTNAVQIYLLNPSNKYGGIL